MKNIILIGMSGVGKSTIGKALSESLNMGFYDTDIIIEETTKLSIEEIFDKYGEAFFREIESKIIKELSSKENQIISSGGGVVLNNNNIVLMKKKGILVLLDSSLENLIDNLMKSSTVRPLLKGKDSIYSKVKELYNTRKEIYNSSADFIVSVDDKSIEEIVYEICNIYDKINY